MYKPVLSFSPKGDVLAIAGRIQDTNMLNIYGVLDSTKKEVAEFSGRPFRMQHLGDIIGVEYEFSPDVDLGSINSDDTRFTLNNKYLSIFTPDQGEVFYFSLWGRSINGVQIGEIVFDIPDMELYWPDFGEVLCRNKGLKAVSGGDKKVTIKRDDNNESLLTVGTSFCLWHSKKYEDIHKNGYRAMSFDTGLVEIYDSGANLIRKIEDFEV